MAGEAGSLFNGKLNSSQCDLLGALLSTECPVWSESGTAQESQAEMPSRSCLEVVVSEGCREAEVWSMAHDFISPSISLHSASGS